MRKIFISSDLSANSVLHQLKDNYQISYASFINFKAIPFDYPSHADCLFFYSKNGVKFFFETQPKLTPNVLVAAMGTGTAALLNDHGVSPSFIGTGSVKEIAKAFQQFIEKKHPIFVKAKNSLSSIQKIIGDQIPSSDLIVYDNQIKKGIEKRDEDILIFTSPLNVKAYTLEHHFNNDQILIAIGERTALALRAFTNSDIKIPKRSTEAGILELVLEMKS